MDPWASFDDQGAGGGYGYPPQQGGYGGYPPQQGGYPPQQGGYPPQQGGYPPQQGGYGGDNFGFGDYGGYPPPTGYPPTGGYPGGYPPPGGAGSYAPSGGYPPLGGPPSGGYPPPGGPPSGGYPPPGGPPSSGYPPPGGPPSGGYPPPGGPPSGGYPSPGGASSAYPPPPGGPPSGGYPPPGGAPNAYPPPGGAASVNSRPGGAPPNAYPPPSGNATASHPGGVPPKGIPPPATLAVPAVGANAAYHSSGQSGITRRKAVLVGINYFKSKFELRGCINDVKNVKQFLLSRGFEDNPKHMITLTDDQTTPLGVPTKQNMINAFKWLVQGAQPGDSLFLHFSGHGGQQKDTDGDEADGFDETILPVDWERNGMIVDDDLHKILVKPLAKGVRLCVVFDSCHSGTALDLPWVYKSSGQYQQPGLSKEQIGKSVISAGLGILKGEDKGKVLKGMVGALYGGYKSKLVDEKNMQTKTSPADVIMISGCRDDQTSADATIAGKATGAMSFALSTLLQKKPEPTLMELLNGMRDILLEGKFTQIPQMSTGHEIDPNSKFFL